MINGKTQTPTSTSTGHTRKKQEISPKERKTNFLLKIDHKIWKQKPPKSLHGR